MQFIERSLKVEEKYLKIVVGFFKMFFCLLINFYLLACFLLISYFLIFSKNHAIPFPGFEKSTHIIKCYFLKKGDNHDRNYQRSNCVG